MSEPRPPGRGGPAPSDFSRAPSVTIFHLLARASYMMPVLALALGMILSAIRGGSQDPIVALVITFVNVAIITTGAVFALIALLGIPRYGRKQILAPALIGLVLNLLFLAMFWGAWNNWRRGASTTTTTTSTTKNVSAAITALSTADFGFDRGTWYSTPPRNDDVP